MYIVYSPQTPAELLLFHEELISKITYSDEVVH